MPFRLFFFLFGAACATAQTTPLALDDAIRLAWANDPAVAALALTPELARAREEQVGIRPNPEVEFRGAVLAKGDSEWAVGVGLNQRLPRRDRIEQARALARLGGARGGRAAAMSQVANARSATQATVAALARI